MPANAITGSLRDSVNPRLHRLGTARAVALHASILGRSFVFPVLRAVAAEEAPSLRRGLQSLAGAGLLFDTSNGNGETFTFKHALIRDAAYDSLTFNTRRLYHRQVADALKARFDDSLHASPELLAHHHQEGREYDLAASFWKRAGASAASSSAFAEAVAHFAAGLACVARLPPSKTRDRQELDLLTATGFPLIATRGYAHADVLRTYVRARELQAALSDTLSSAERSMVLSGLVLDYGTLPDLVAMREVSAELANVALQDGAADVRVVAEGLLGLVMWQGDLDDARQHLELAVGLYAGERLGWLRDVFGHDPLMVAQCYLV